MPCTQRLGSATARASAAQTPPGRELRGPVGRTDVGCPRRVVRMTVLAGHPPPKPPSQGAIALADHWLQRAAARDRGGGGLRHGPGADGCSQQQAAASRKAGRGGSPGRAAAGAAAPGPGGSRSQAPQHSWGSASASAVAGKTAVAGPRGNVPQPSPGPRHVSGGGRDTILTAGEEPDLEFGAATKKDWQRAAVL